jgi:hypothetical protein
MARPRDPRYTPRSNPPRATAQRATPPAAPRPIHGDVPRPSRPRPNANPMRLMLGLAGLASVSALTAAMVPSIAPQPAADAFAAEPAAAVTAQEAAAPVRHVTRYVTLAPGQTPPPGSTSQAQPKPTPIVKVKVVTRTRQSGQP